MTDHRPEPLVPAEVDLRDMDGFMLNVERLLASELWALSTGDELKAALGLWCRAWKQLPAASVPDNERILASFAAVPISRWPKIRDMAMRGFVLCSDGRWYHKVLAEDALRAWDRKRAFRERSARGNAKRWARDDDTQGDQDGSHKESLKDEITSNKESNKDSLSLPRDRTGLDETGQDRDKKNPRATRARALNGHSQDFETFWNAYPNRVDHRSAERAYAEAIERADPSLILEGAKLYAAARKDQDHQYTKRPDNWLRADGWTEYGAKVVRLTPEQDAAARDKADRLMRRGKYAEQNQ